MQYFFFFQLILKKAQVQMLQNRIFQNHVSLDFVLLVIHGCHQLNSPHLVLSGAPASPQSQANQMTESRLIKTRQPTVSQTTWFSLQILYICCRETKRNKEYLLPCCVLAAHFCLLLNFMTYIMLDTYFLIINYLYRLFF